MSLAVRAADRIVVDDIPEYRVTATIDDLMHRRDPVLDTALALMRDRR
jgi:hypothetical protein